MRDLPRSSLTKLHTVAERTKASASLLCLTKPKVNEIAYVRQRPQHSLRWVGFPRWSVFDRRSGNSLSVLRCLFGQSLALRWRSLRLASCEICIITFSASGVMYSKMSVFVEGSRSFLVVDGMSSARCHEHFVLGGTGRTNAPRNRGHFFGLTWLR